MPLQLANANVVIVAYHFNPTITDQLWLTEHAIVNRDEPAGPYVFTDMLVQVPTKDFHLLIVPDRCQLTPSPQIENAQQLIVERLGRLVELLPHTPYRAVGLNFNWHFSRENDDIERFARARFFVPGSPLHELFSVEGSRFGGYMSKGFHNGRLKLDIKPAQITTEEARQEVMQFAFNFNLELTDDGNKVQQIMAFLNRWNEARDAANQTAKTGVEGFDQ
jgi:hypothetical protein